MGNGATPEFGSKIVGKREATDRLPSRTDDSGKGMGGVIRLRRGFGGQVRDA